ncbi:DUF429 domain-containing protein [Haliangium sp.]|uniref:DUF429 domain-containing protein n=1 Tax=Haliangium sp. TaxID=2663208 RepID=UPI003D0EA787
MKRRFATYIGIDLGGARGKTTAVAHLAPAPEGDDDGAGIAVREVQTRVHGVDPWHDTILIEYLESLAGPVVIAVNAPLTVPACLRCELPACPGKQACEDPAVQWLYGEGQELVSAALAGDRDRIAAVPAGAGRRGHRPHARAPRSKPVLEPYTHRAAEISLHYGRGLIPRDALGLGTGPIAARAMHLRKRLAGLGYTLHRDLLEVSPRATVQALFGPREARGYKRDADPWHTRAAIVEGLSDLRFAPSSRLSREEVLRNDHCFEALLSAYTAYLWARDGWTLPEGVYADDGWIWAPPH